MDQNCSFMEELSGPQVRWGQMVVGIFMLQMVVGSYSFIPFIIILFIFGTFFFRKLPETKNKSYSEIYEDMGLEELAKEAHKEEDDDNLASITFVSHV